MDRKVWNIFCRSAGKRVALLCLSFTCVLFCAPKSAYCHEDQNDQIMKNDELSWHVDEFEIKNDDREMRIEDTADFVEETSQDEQITQNDELNFHLNEFEKKMNEVEIRSGDEADPIEEMGQDDQIAQTEGLIFHFGEFEKKIDELEMRIDDAVDPVEESRQFLISFLANIEAEYNIKLSLAEACELGKRNLHLFDLPEEEKASVLLLLDLFILRDQITNENKLEAQTHCTANGVSFGRLFQSKPNSLSSLKLGAHSYFEPSAKSVELFMGALLCLIPNSHANQMGHEAFLDGCNR